MQTGEDYTKIYGYTKPVIFRYLATGYIYMRRIIAAVVAVIAAMTLCACHRSEKITGFEDLSGKTVGVLSDFVMSDKTLSGEKDVTVARYGDIVSLAEAVKSGAVAGAVVSETESRRMTDYSSRLTVLDGNYESLDYCLITADGNSAMLTMVDAALSRLDGAGTLDDILDKWEDGVVGAYKPQERDWDSVVKVAVCTAQSPMQTKDDNGAPAGMEIDVLYAVADILGVELEIYDMDSEESLIYMVESGKVALGIGGVYDDGGAEHRLLYSKPYMTAAQVVVVLK